MTSYVYTGPKFELVGRRALLMRSGTRAVVAQFDDVSTGYGFGWYEFSADEFEITVDELEALPAGRSAPSPETQE